VFREGESKGGKRKQSRGGTEKKRRREREREETIRLTERKGEEERSVTSGQTNFGSGFLFCDAVCN